MNEILFKDFIKLQRGFDLPKTQMIEGDYPVIGSTTIIGYHNEYKVDPPGVITGRSGSLGFVQYITKKYWPHNTSLWVKDYKGNNPKYVYYFLKVFRLERFNSGAGVPTLNRNDLDNYEIQIHEIEIQQKIASILSAYDDLIENNTRRIKILEEMAQTIYKEWFVNFRFPGHEKVKFVNSSLGKIPEGWEKIPFQEIIDFKEGPGLRKWQYRDEGIPFLNIRVIKNNDVDFNIIKYLDPEEVNKMYSHFLLQENDHVLSTSGTLGRVVTIRKYHLPLCLNTSLIRFRPLNDRIGEWQIKHLIKSDGFLDLMKSFATGAAQSNFGPTHLKQIILDVPPIKLSERYEELVTPIEETIKIILDKNLNLRKTRDLLLPKLMSGELEV